MLYRFSIELSDIDRGVYETLDFRVAQHPSETGPYLVSRILAFALCYQEGLEFTPGGLSDPDAPAIRLLNAHGTIDYWIEIGNPSARKLHKASKAASKVAVFTYKSPALLIDEIKNNTVHRASEIPIYAFEQKSLSLLEGAIEKSNRWSLLHQQGQVDVETGKNSVSLELKKFSI